MTSLAQCRCPRDAQVACSVLATQEDLLCDVCRDGCSVVRFGPVGASLEELRQGWHAKEAVLH